jgi:hypothetical protein
MECRPSACGMLSICEISERARIQRRICISDGVE